MYQSLYDGQLLCGLYVAIKRLSPRRLSWRFAQRLWPPVCSFVRLFVCLSPRPRSGRYQGCHGCHFSREKLPREMCASGGAYSITRGFHKRPTLVSNKYL